MAPMTRNRTPDTVPNALNAEYYAQRASAGLIVTEGMQPSAVGQGYPGTPGLHTDAQTEGWRAVADAVHAQGGRIVAQLMHAGRISHPVDHRHDAGRAVRRRGPPARSSPAAACRTSSTPRALETDELPGVVAEFVDAARRAVDAGLDGVELHAANGYLLQQFLADGTNQRTDGYGGSPENRARFVVEVAAAVAAEIGADTRRHPHLARRHLQRHQRDRGRADLRRAARGPRAARPALPARRRGPGHELPRAASASSSTGPSSSTPASPARPTSAPRRRSVDGGQADLFAIGRAFLANPDLVERLRTGAALNEGDQATFYGGGAEGYTDYPTLSA